MKKILIVDDDAVIATLYRFKLTSEGFSVKTARNGEEAIQSAENETPDLVILDWMLPKIDGIGVLKYLRDQPATKETPVIMFSNNFIHIQEQEALKAGASRCIAKASFTCKQMIDVIAELLSLKPSAVVEDFTQNQDNKAVAGVEPSGVMMTSPNIKSARIKPVSNVIANIDFQADVIKQVNELSPEWFKRFRKDMEALAFTKEVCSRTGSLGSISRTAHTMCGHMAMANFTEASQLASGIVALSNILLGSPSKITPSTIRTLAQAMDLTAAMIQRMQPNCRATLNPALVLCVDDAPLQRKLLLASVEKVKLRAVVVEDAAMALRLVEENAFNLFFLDVEMPGMNGFELCAKLRAMPQYASVPIIFVTAHADFQAHNRSILSGGTDFISKPYIDVELGVKALIYLMNNQFQVNPKEMRGILSAVESDIIW